MQPSFEPDFSLNELFLRSDPSRPPLRIGVMTNGRECALFVRQILTDISRCDFAKIVCVIENQDPPSKPPPVRSLPARAWNAFLHGSTRRELLFQWYVRLFDERRKLRPDPLSRADCSDLLAAATVIPVVPERSRFVDVLPQDAVDRIRAQDLDVILRFGFRILRGPVLQAARHGVWSFHHDDSRHYRGVPAQFWEIVERNPVSGAVLQRLNESLDGGAVLSDALLGSTNTLSMSRNRFHVYWTTQHFVIHKLWELHRFGAEHVAKRTVENPPYHGRKPLYRKPTNFEMVRWLVPGIARQMITRCTERRRVVHWRIGLRRTSTPLWETAGARAVSEFRWLESPRGRFWADPFLLQHEGGTWLFFEDFEYALRRGTIACGRLDENGELHDVHTVLDRPYHLSYPHVFRHDGEIWMVPESEQSRKVELWRATRFPDEWRLERTLLDLRAVDATPFEHDGRWWMFLSPMVVRPHTPTTLLFSAPALLGDWSLHRASPISTDVRVSRSAGSVIRTDGRLIRPSQDCSVRYGFALTFNDILRLDATDYAERQGARLGPDVLPRCEGIHTYNAAGGWEALDGQFPIPARGLLASGPTAAREARGAPSEPISVGG